MDGCCSSASRRSRAVTAAASSSAPSSTSASTRSGATGKTPGSSTRSRTRVLPDGAEASAARCRLVRQQRRDPDRTKCLQPIPARRLSPPRARSPERAHVARGLRKPAAGGEQRAAALVHRPEQQLVVGRLGPLVEQLLRRPPIARRAARARTGADANSAYETGSPRSSGDAQHLGEQARAPDRSRRARRGAGRRPDPGIRRDTERRPTRRGSARSRSSIGRPAGCAPSSGCSSAAARSRGRRARAPSASAAHASASADPRDPDRRRIARELGEHGRTQQRVGPALDERLLQIAEAVVVADVGPAFADRSTARAPRRARRGASRARGRERREPLQVARDLEIVARAEAPGRCARPRRRR